MISAALSLLLGMAVFTVLARVILFLGGRVENGKGAQMEAENNTRAYWELQRRQSEFERIPNPNRLWTAAERQEEAGRMLQEYARRADADALRYVKDGMAADEQKEFDALNAGCILIVLFVLACIALAAAYYVTGGEIILKG